MNVAGRLAFAAQGAFFLEVMELKDVIVVFPVKETALSLRALIEKNGFHVSCVCALGTSALDAAQHTTQGVMVCPFLMRDMSAAELAEQLPNGFDVIALSKNGVEQYMGNGIYKHRSHGCKQQIKLHPQSGGRRRLHIKSQAGTYEH